MSTSCTTVDWRQGIASSLRAALEAIAPYAEVTAVCVGLADQPQVGSEAYRRLAAAHADGAQLAVATYDGVRGNPVLLARSLWAEANELEGDVGARAAHEATRRRRGAVRRHRRARWTSIPHRSRTTERGASVKIEDEFRVDVPIDEAWKVLLDVERIAPCMPGAQLQEIEGDEYRGIVKIKVGPITAQYKGAARIVETDEDAHQVVLKAEGRDTRGQGNASATVTATLTADGERHRRAHRHRPEHHRQGRAVRAGSDGRRLEQAARAVRRRTSSATC